MEGSGHGSTSYIVSPRARGTVNYKSQSPLNGELAVPEGYDVDPEGMDPQIQDRIQGAQTMTQTVQVGGQMGCPEMTQNRTQKRCCLGVTSTILGCPDGDPKWGSPKWGYPDIDPPPQTLIQR